MKTPDLILTADFHLRDTVPIGRKNSYFEEQEAKIDFILNLQKEYNVPIIVAGDIFHKAISSSYLESWCISKFKNAEIHTIFGNHDLPDHNIQNLKDSSINVLIQADVIYPIMSMYDINNIHFIGTHYGQIITSQFLIPKGEKIVSVKHKMISNIKESFSYIPAKKELDLDNADIILVGHNHKTFIVKKGNKILLSPGSLMRMTVGQKEHKPSVFLYYKQDNSIEQIFLPIKEDIFSEVHIKTREEKKENEYMSHIVENINNDYEIDVNFIRNLESYILKNNISNSVQNEIFKCTNKEK